MDVYIGSDHRGYEAKLELIEYLNEKGLDVTDLGCPSSDRADYPDYGKAVGEQVAAADGQAFGIVLCGSGVGIAIPANKVKGVRCVVAWCEHVAEFGRRHNHANVLAFGTDVQTVAQMKLCLDAYLNAEKEGGRHAERVAKINAMG